MDWRRLYYMVFPPPVKANKESKIERLLYGNMVKNLEYSELMHSRHQFLVKNVVAYMDRLKTFLEKDWEKERVPKYIINTSNLPILSYIEWYTDGKYLVDDINQITKEFLYTSAEFTNRFNRFKENSDAVVSYNIRNLRSYIIDIEEIVESVYSVSLANHIMS